MNIPEAIEEFKKANAILRGGDNGSIRIAKTIVRNDLAITALEAQQADTWIPISSGIVPEANDGDWAAFVIPGIFTTGSTRITARYFKGHGIKHEDGWTDKRVEKATHWMPLPEPWKEEQP